MPADLAGKTVGIAVKVAYGGLLGIMLGRTGLTNALVGAVNGALITASIAGDPTMVYRAICHDPLTASILSLAEIKSMVNEMFAQNKDYLPQFKHLKV